MGGAGLPHTRTSHVPRSQYLGLRGAAVWPGEQQPQHHHQRRGRGRVRRRQPARKMLNEGDAGRLCGNERGERSNKGGRDLRMMMERESLRERVYVREVCHQWGRKCQAAKRTPLFMTLETSELWHFRPVIPRLINSDVLPG